MISERGDYTCEIMAIVVLGVLSALSHFWHVFIAICVGAAVVGIGLLLRWIVLCSIMTGQTKETR